jgi:citrate lyase subunit beta/citryl-CoA lyase
MPTITPPLDITHTPPQIAPCEHIAGNEKFALKALEIQTRHLRANGSSLVDVTLDLEDGSPIGQEAALRATFINILTSPQNTLGQIGLRVHAPTSPHFELDLAEVIAKAGDRVKYITIPKITSLREVMWAEGLITHYLTQQGARRRVPLHLLIETPEALNSVDQLASHHLVETLDFGLMDFISHFGGAIPSAGMHTPRQFDHPIIAMAKAKIATAALSHNKVANHNVTVNVRSAEQAYHDSYRARHDFGFLRMWSIHPDQIAHIIRGMIPTVDELAEARAILMAANAASWGPIEYAGRLHDRASYRYYWGILSQSGQSLEA